MERGKIRGRAHVKPSFPSGMRTCSGRTQCPLWVKSGHRTGSAECPLYPLCATSGHWKVCPTDVRFNLGSGHRGASLPTKWRKCLSAHPFDLKCDKRPAFTDAIRLPARAAFRAASRQDGNSGSLLRSPPTIQSGPKSLNRDTRRNARRSNLPHCDRAGSS
jgi:hypothetical protein